MFSEKLKKLRISHNLTQKQLADNLFIDRSLVAKYETNKAKPTKEIFQRIVEFFEVEPSYFDYKKVSHYIPITSDQLLARKINIVITVVGFGDYVTHADTLLNLLTLL